MASSLSVDGLYVLVGSGLMCGRWRGLPHICVAASCAAGALGSPAPGGRAWLLPLKPPLAPTGEMQSR